MIAPLDEFRKNPEPGQTMMALRRARRMVASMMPARRPSMTHDSPQVAPWKAWLFAGWVTVTFIVYGLAWIGSKLSES